MLKRETDVSESRVTHHHTQGVPEHIAAAVSLLVSAINRINQGAK